MILELKTENMLQKPLTLEVISQIKLLKQKYDLARKFNFAFSYMSSISVMALTMHFYSSYGAAIYIIAAFLGASTYSLINYYLSIYAGAIFRLKLSIDGEELPIYEIDHHFEISTLDLEFTTGKAKQFLSKITSNRAVLCFERDIILKLNGIKVVQE